MIWIGIIVGVVVMQLATLMIVYATGEDEDVVIIFSVFIFYPIIRLLQIIIDKIKRVRRRKRKWVNARAAEQKFSG